MQRSLIALALVAVAGASVVVAAARWGGDSGQGPQEMVLEDLRFVPNRLDARVGVPLRVVLRNSGTERHDLSFPSLHMPGLAGLESILEPGERRTVTLTFDQPGTHTFECTLPGHAAAGMTDAVYVTP